MIELFRFARPLELVMVFAGIVAGILSGLTIPASTNLFAQLSEAMINYGAEDGLQLCDFNITIDLDQLNITGYNPMSSSEFLNEVTHFGIGLSVLGCIQLALCYFMVVCLNTAAEMQVYFIRSKYLRSVLRQDIGWYDMHGTGEFASRSTDDMGKLQDGMGEKIGMFCFFLSSSAFNIVNAFVHGWLLTLVMLAVVPIIIAAMALIGIVQTSLSRKELEAYALSGSVAEEALTAIRTVAAFGGEKKESERYESKLIFASKVAVKRGLLTGVGAAIVWFSIFGSCALAFWYGIKLILDDRGQPNPTYGTSTLINVFFSVLQGAMNLGSITPYVEAFSQARAAATSIFSVIDREPPIDSSSPEGLQPKTVTGNIGFEGVHFRYPSRKDVPVLNGLDLQVHSGETVALVGESGCGKSTVVQLLQRFYDPAEGVVKIDGCDIRLLNIGWLREQIGVVGQEPILFGTTIAENIRYGNEGATLQDIKWAAKQANAHKFIMKLPKQYDTPVGDRGAQLSGGQKQRVAIARALIKNPKILLLDEATSALDSESEAVVQEALDKASKGRTTIIIAHRLSTIRNANKIAAISNGRIVEIGSHQQLMDLKGIYFLLNATQNAKPADEMALEKHGMLQETSPALQRHPMLEYERSLSTLSENSVEDIFGQAAPFTNRQTSFRVAKAQRTFDDMMSTDEESSVQPSLMKIMKMNRQEWPFILFGCIGAFGMGFTMPAFSLLFGNMMKILSYCNENETREKSVLYSYYFLVVAACTAILCFLQIFMLAVAGDGLTKRLRKLSFAAMLKQEIAYFDEPVHGVGALCSRLSGDAASVQGATGLRIGTILQSISSLCFSVIIAFILMWKLALVTSCFIPLIIVAAYLHRLLLKGQSITELTSLDKANKIAIEAISNVRTVASLHKEATFHATYMDLLKEPHRKSLRMSHMRGLVFGFAQSVPFFAYAASMSYGGYLIVNENVDYSIVFKVAEILILGTTTVGQAFALAPNYNKGLLAAGRIFNLLERQPLIDASADSGDKLPEEAEGMLEFKDVGFHYPMRPDMPVLRQFNLKVTTGHLLALVGSSGCGKSTCVQLLERFYDSTSGSVTMDGIDIKKLNLQFLRSRIGIVFQEPILFNTSISYNIAYGDNQRTVEMEEIIQAARKANIHNFISTLPQGYDTLVGDKGTQLSGGQKQRIAIARALIRNPKILLLDEATSALDTESEKIVQEALDEAQKGRTCISIAHRLSTIKHANNIAVIHQGNVVELGSHDELLERKSHYYKFYETQTKGHTATEKIPTN